MILTLRLVILFLALLLFALSAADIKPSRLNLMALGLVFLTLAEIIGK